MKFDPNKDLRDLYAVYNPRRNPKFKIYHQRGHAINALKNASHSRRHDVYHYEYNQRVIPEDVTFWVLKDNKWIEIEFNRVYNSRDTNLGLNDAN